MESSNESVKVSLLEDQTPQAQHLPRPLPKKTIFFSFIVLFSFISVAGILFLVQKHTFTRSKAPDPYTQRSQKFYCHVTSYPDLCFSSMLPFINRTTLERSPNPIFSGSLWVAISQLRNSTGFISRSMESISGESSTGSTLNKCVSMLNRSLSQLNNSLATLGVDQNIQALTYEEEDNIRAWNVAAMNSAEDCFFTLEDIEPGEIEGEKMAVGRSRMCLVNWLELFNSKEIILYEFYNPMLETDYSYDYYPSYYSFDYGFILFLYGGMYLFLAVLFVLFLRGDR